MIPERLYRLALSNAYAAGGYDAGGQMYNFYPNADRIFPILPDNIEILPDTPAGTWGLAWFLGLNPDGIPRFAVRDDLTLNSKIAWHEDGHALEAVLIERIAQQQGIDTSDAEDQIRTRYWNWRGFYIHGTWQKWLQYAYDHGTSGGWAYLPGESIAESISAAVGGYVESEWTNNFGLDLAINNGIYDPSGGGMRSRVFWQGLMQEVDLDEATVARIATDKASEAIERYKVLDDMTVEAVKDRLAIDAHHTHKVKTSNGSVTDLSTGEPIEAA